jgi:hypothetical protein
MESEAAECIATEIYDVIHNDVATKADILAVRGDIVLLRAEIKADVAAVRGEMHKVESRIGIRLWRADRHRRRRAIRRAARRAAA